MVATSETAYPAILQRDDRRRGHRDGKRRTPSLAEVRRQQRELAETGGRPTVGYQVLLLAELSESLTGLHITYQRLGAATALQLGRYEQDIRRAREDAQRATERLDAARNALDQTELLPRNAEEEHWSEELLRNRREVARARRIARARDELTQAHDRIAHLRAERATTESRHREAASDLGDQARRMVELCRRRTAEYLSALAETHPDGRTLHPLLALSEIPLPSWVTESSHPDDTRSTR